jgi:AraC-like DNA-binding protein
MFHMQTATTEGIAARKRLQFWNELTSEALTEQCAEADDPTAFSGRIRRIDLGTLRLAEICASSSRVKRTQSHISHATEAPYVMRLLLSGELASVQGGVEVRQKPGDFVLYDTSRPYQLIVPSKTKLLSIRIPQEQLLRYFPCPESVTGLVLSGTSETGKIALRFLKGFWFDSGSAILGISAPRIADIALQLIASCYAMLPKADIGSSRQVVRHRVAILMHIEEHLCDPDLSPTSIATALNLSPGYIHKLFADNSDSIARLIIKRRLERCRDAFDDRLQRVRSVTEIAFMFGFNSLAHFSRVFRERFGVSPREYRQIVGKGGALPGRA